MKTRNITSQGAESRKRTRTFFGILTAAVVSSTSAALIGLTAFALSAVTATAGVILSDSFESPVVTGQEVTTAPDGWVIAKDGAFKSDRAGLANVDGVTFTTTFGNQAACSFYHTAALVTEAATFSDALWTGVTYTVTFNVAKGSDLSGNYKVELLVFSPGENRYSDDAGTVLAYASGTATTNDMSETDSFTFGPVDAHADLGKLLALQIEGDGALVDNLVFTDDTVSDVVPPALMNLSPLDDETWVEVDQNLVVTFNETVTSGSGNIEIRRTSDNSVVETIAVGSAQVSISGAQVTIDPTANFEEGVEHYVLFDSGTLKDSANNDFVGISSTTTWSFTTTQPDGIREIFYESFESPVVTGQSADDTVPPGWVRVIGNYNSHKVTLYNEDTGDFSTPYGAQAFYANYNKNADLITDTNTITQVYEPGVTYTLKFNAAVINGSVQRQYDVQLVSYADGLDPADKNAAVTIVDSVNGWVSTTDMRESSGLVFTAPEGEPYLGGKISIRLDGRNGDGGYVLIDNLKLTDDKQPETAAGTVIFIR